MADRITNQGWDKFCVDMQAMHRRALDMKMFDTARAISLAIQKSGCERAQQLEDNLPRCQGTVCKGGKTRQCQNKARPGKGAGKYCFMHSFLEDKSTNYIERPR